MPLLFLFPPGVADHPVPGESRHPGVAMSWEFLSPLPMPLYTQPSRMNASGSMTFRPSTMTGCTCPVTLRRCAGSSALYSRCPVKIATASAPSVTASMSREIAMPGSLSTQGSWTLTSPPPAHTSSRKTPDGVFRASPEFAMNAHPRMATFEPRRVFPTRCRPASARWTMCRGMKSLIARAVRYRDFSPSGQSRSDDRSKTPLSRWYVSFVRQWPPTPAPGQRTARVTPSSLRLAIPSRTSYTLIPIASQ